MTDAYRKKLLRRGNWTFLIIPVVFGVAHMRLREVPQAWYDEAATISCIQRTPAELIDLLGHLDLVHAAYYFTAYAWSRMLGLDLLTLRSLSVLVFSGTLLVCGVLASLISSTNRHVAAHSTMLVLAVMPGSQWMAIDARGYVFVLFFFAVTLLLIKLDLTHHRMPLTVLAACSMFATLTYSLLFVLAVPVLVVFHVLQAPPFWRPKLVWVYGVFAVPTALFGGFCFQQRAQVDWIANVRFGMWDQISRGQYFVSSYNRLPESSADVAATVIAQVLVLALVVLALTRRSAWLWALCALVVVPLAGIAVIHSLLTPLYITRYLAFTSVALALLVGCSLAYLKWKSAAGLVAVLSLAQMPALADAAVPYGKFGEQYTTLAAIRCEVDAVYYGDILARSLTAVEQQCQADDPMAVDDAPRSSTLFGTQRDFEAKDIDYHRKVLVVQIVSRLEWLAEVEKTAKSQGCSNVQRIPSSRFHALILTCPH